MFTCAACGKCRRAGCHPACPRRGDAPVARRPRDGALVFKYEDRRDPHSAARCLGDGYGDLEESSASEPESGDEKHGKGAGGAAGAKGAGAGAGGVGRPPGRAPKGKRWDGAAGAWVPDPDGGGGPAGAGGTAAAPIKEPTKQDALEWLRRLRAALATDDYNKVIQSLVAFRAKRCSQGDVRAACRPLLAPHAALWAEFQATWCGDAFAHRKAEPVPKISCSRKTLFSGSNALRLPPLRPGPARVLMPCASVLRGFD